MKKLFTTLVMSALLLAACGNEESAMNEDTGVDEAATEETTNTEENATDEEKGKRTNPYVIGETAEFEVVYYDDANEAIEGVLRLTINDITVGEEADEFIMSENEFNEPAPDGYQFAILDATAELVEGSEEVEYDLLLTQEIFDDEGQSVNLDDVYASTGNRLSDQSLFPGGTAEGYIIPVVPEDLAGTLMKVENLGGGDSVWFQLG